jgi:hypothetical protein
VSFLRGLSVRRLPIIPIAAGTGGILFPECTQQIKVSGEELSVVRSIEGEQLPLFGYCTVGEVRPRFKTSLFVAAGRIPCPPLYLWPSVADHCSADARQDGDLLPVGTMALLEKVEWSQLTPEEGGDEMMVIALGAPPPGCACSDLSIVRPMARSAT